MSETGRALRELRQACGISQAELARRAHTSQATVAAYEAGTKEPSVATFRRLIRALGIQINFTPTGRPSPEEAARQLEEVLDFVDGFPYPPENRPLRFPVMTHL